MRMPKQSIATQLIILLVLSVLTAQIPIAAVFLSRADAISDVFEQKFQIEKIADTYKAVSNRYNKDNEQLLKASNGLDLSFSVSTTPLFTGELEHQKYVEWFNETLGNVDITFTEEKISAIDQWEFWFSDQDEQCFEALLAQDFSHNCPYKAFSLKLDGGRWLNAVSGMASNNGIVLVPVLFSAFVTLLGFSFVIIFAIRKITSPLRDLEIATEQLGRGQDVEKLAVRGPRELSTTVSAFNEMQERLTRFVHDRTHMLAAISHDLRTPITSLRIRTEFIDNVELRDQMIQTLEDMQVMVESCLSFAHQDIIEEKTEEHDIVKLVESAVSEINGASFSSNINSYPYPCRQVNFKRAIRNVVENGVKYGDAANLSVDANDEGVYISIRDEGDGIPEKDLENIFEPFIRLDKSRNVESGNVGLGLTIARTIVHKHGGKIQASNSDNGLKVVLSLPAYTR